MDLRRRRAATSDRPLASPARRRGAALLALAGWLAVSASVTAAAEEYEQDRIRWLGVSRHIAVLAGRPADAGEGGAPLMLVLGEPGRSARYALDSWRPTTEREPLIVAAVSSAATDAWRLAPDGPEFLRTVVERVAAGHVVDRRRLYLFGSGSGGDFAVRVALLQPEYFAAVASFGGYLTRGGAGPIGGLERPIPIFLFRALADPRVGSGDLAESADWMRQAGAAVVVEELKAPVGFERRGRRTAERIWSALASHRLATTPRFVRSGQQ